MNFLNSFYFVGSVIFVCLFVSKWREDRAHLWGNLEEILVHKPQHSCLLAVHNPP